MRPASGSVGSLPTVMYMLPSSSSILGIRSASITRIQGVHGIAAKYSAASCISLSVIAAASAFIVGEFGLRGSALRRRPSRMS